MNTYYVYSAKGRQEAGTAQDRELAAADALMIANFGTLPLTDPSGGRPISVGRVWVERVGSAGWTPIVWVNTSAPGTPPPQSDAPSSPMIPVLLLAGAALVAAVAFGWIRV